MSNLKPAVGDKDHIQGNPSAPIELVEYGDYECPHCGRAYPIIKRIQQTFGSDLKFVFRNFPLAEAHPHATHAAIASEAAGNQGRFWEMHDIIYEHQFALQDKDLTKYAVKAGAAADQFAKDFADEKFAGKVETDFESGIRSGVNGTPSFFINGRKYGGDWSEEAFTEHLQGMLPRPHQPPNPNR